MRCGVPPGSVFRDRVKGTGWPARVTARVHPGIFTRASALLRTVLVCPAPRLPRRGRTARPAVHHCRSTPRGRRLGRAEHRCGRGLCKATLWSRSSSVSWPTGWGRARGRCAVGTALEVLPPTRLLNPVRGRSPRLLYTEAMIAPCTRRCLIFSRTRSPCRALASPSVRWPFGYWDGTSRRG